MRTEISINPIPASTPLSDTAETATPASAWWIVPLGLVGGLALGIVFRLWMRLIADDPDFTWAGTLAIVLGFGWFGLWQSAAHLMRHGRRTWLMRVGRVAGSLGIAPLFMAAGGVMAPTVIGWSMACSGPSRPRWSRVAAGIAGSAQMVLLGRFLAREFGLTAVQTVGGLAGAVVLYALVAVAARPTFARDGRSWPVPAVVPTAIVCVLAAAFAVMLWGVESF